MCIVGTIGRRYEEERPGGVDDCIKSQWRVADANWRGIKIVEQYFVLVAAEAEILAEPCCSML